MGHSLVGTVPLKHWADACERCDHTGYVPLTLTRDDRIDTPEKLACSVCPDCEGKGWKSQADVERLLRRPVPHGQTALTDEERQEGLGRYLEQATAKFQGAG